MFDLVNAGVVVSDSIMSLKDCKCDSSISDELLVAASQEYDTKVKNGGGLGASQKFENQDAVADDSDSEMDALLLEASQKFENEEAGVDDSDHVDDALFLEASQKFEQNKDDDGGLLVEKKGASRKSRFGSPVSNKKLNVLKKSGVPLKTQRTTSWAENVWKEWVKERQSVAIVEDNETIIPLTKYLVACLLNPFAFGYQNLSVK